MKGDSIISNATQLWEAFDRLAKLKDEAYDKALTEDIHRSLGIDSHTNLKKAIYNNRVSVETLLAAILNSLQPFSRMLSDLLKLFERIGARQSDKNLRISFDFECGEAFDFDMKCKELHFRSKFASILRSRRMSVERYWASSTVTTVCSPLSTER